MSIYWKKKVKIWCKIQFLDQKKNRKRILRQVLGCENGELFVFPNWFVVKIYSSGIVRLYWYFLHFFDFELGKATAVFLVCFFECFIEQIDRAVKPFGFPVVSDLHQMIFATVIRNVIVNKRFNFFEMFRLNSFLLFFVIKGEEIRKGEKIAFIRII